MKIITSLEKQILLGPRSYRNHYDFYEKYVLSSVCVISPVNKFRQDEAVHFREENPDPTINEDAETLPATPYRTEEEENEAVSRLIEEIEGISKRPRAEATGVPDREFTVVFVKIRSFRREDRYGVRCRAIVGVVDPH